MSTIVPSVTSLASITRGSWSQSATARVLRRITDDYPMIERDEAFVEGRRRFFHQLHHQTGDAWHRYTQKIIESTTREWFERLSEKPVDRILNAGSGGSAYGIDQRMTHLDLFESNLGNVEERVVANVADIPVESGSFDVAICVGSVLNYADPVG